ncbi:MAG TPA: phosphotransferase [Candidatus Dormibacteraeota bacterium]
MNLTAKDAGTRRRSVRLEPSLDALLAGVTHRAEWKTSDSLSGGRFERVQIDGVPLVLKRVCVDDDWIMRGTGDLECYQVTLHVSHLLDHLPAAIDDALIACAPFTSPQGHRGAALLLRDVSASLVPPGSDTVSLAAHRAFLAHMAEMHAAYWGFRDSVGLIPLLHHYTILTPTMAALELARGGTDPVPRAVRQGWTGLDRTHPEDTRILRALAADPAPLGRVLGSKAQTLIHGDWKFGNLGADGASTILLDWDRCGQASPLMDLAWYLAVNCDRLPETKEAAIDAYRAALDAHGIDTAPWWDAHLRVALAGAFLQLAWSKTGDDVEYAWWSQQLRAALPLL